MGDFKTIKVALAGCGTVGSGVTELIVERATELANRTGLKFDIVRVLVSDVNKPRHVALDPSTFTDDIGIFNAAEADLVVEVLGGTTTAREVMLSALRKGIPVVTANKALLAEHGVEVFRAARENRACVAFESSCAGGLPIIRPLLGGLLANRIDRIFGIFNSTCNFILTRMLDGSDTFNGGNPNGGKGASFEDVVADAQRAGYAEADPTLDIDGTDTAHKLTILASLAFGLNLDFRCVLQEGIENVSLVDLRVARRIGYACKLIGLGQRFYDVKNDRSESVRPEQPSQRVALIVHPMLIPQHHPMAGMGDTSSAVVVDGDALGSSLFSGAGAGAVPTASGVVADMIEVSAGAATAMFNQVRVFNDQTPEAAYVSANEIVSQFYIRFACGEPRTTVAMIEQAWRQSSVMTKSVTPFEDFGSVAIVTAPVPREALQAALHQVSGTLKLATQPVVLPVLAP